MQELLVSEDFLTVIEENCLTAALQKQQQRIALLETLCTHPVFDLSTLSYPLILHPK
jgi:hypothetical protein